MNRMQTGTYRLITAVVTATLLSAAGAAGATGPSEAGVQPNPGQTSPEFTRLDMNRDGSLSREEAQKIRGFSKAFNEADDNGDGKLDATEFVKARAIHDRARAGQYIDDSVITAKVKAALLKDPVVSAVVVSVETHKGTVLLSGFVDNESQARRAVKIAASVQGVVAVKNSLSVKS